MTHSHWPAPLPFSSPSIDGTDRKAFAGALRPGGDQGAVHRAQAHVANMIGVPASWVLMTNSGTAALTIAYHFFFKAQRERGLPEKLEAPILTWPATYCCAPSYHLMDGDEHVTYFSDEKDIIRTDVQLWGNKKNHQAARDLTSFMVLDASHNILDPTHAGMLNSRQIDAVIYSFGPIKQATAWRGGCVISPHITQEWRAFANVGTENREGTYPFGGNFVMAEPNAGLLVNQLARWETMQAHRRSITNEYQNVVGPRGTARGGGSGHLAVMLADTEMEKMRVVAALDAHRIMTGLHYPLPPTVAPINFSEARDVAARAITLPCHCEMTIEDAKLVASILKDTLAK